MAQSGVKTAFDERRDRRGSAQPLPHVSLPRCTRSLDDGVSYDGQPVSKGGRLAQEALAECKDTPVHNVAVENTLRRLLGSMPQRQWAEFICRDWPVLRRDMLARLEEVSRQEAVERERKAAHAQAQQWPPSPGSWQSGGTQGASDVYEFGGAWQTMGEPSLDSSWRSRRATFSCSRTPRGGHHDGSPPPVRLKALIPTYTQQPSARHNDVFRNVHDDGSARAHATVTAHEVGGAVRLHRSRSCPGRGLVPGDRRLQLLAGVARAKSVRGYELGKHLPLLD
jgi:hypothetical protein